MQDPLRVMSFNVRGANRPEDGENDWVHRADLNVRTIKRYAPDIIGFQEFQEDNLAVYKQHLTEYAYSVGPRYNSGDPYEYPAIFWNPARCRPVITGGFWLSDTPEQHSASWDTAVIRSAQWIKFQRVTDDTSFVLLNTHLDHISELARVEGSKLILQQLQPMIADKIPVILIGDWNDEPNSATYRLFLEHGFVDTFAAAGYHDDPGTYTFHGFKGDNFAPWSASMIVRIDWILTLDGAQRINTHALTIARDSEPPLYPSDHYPLIADLVFSAASSL